MSLRKMDMVGKKHNKIIKSILIVVISIIVIFSNKNISIASVTGNLNETVVYNFLINNMKCNIATANIQKESNFNPTATVIDTNGKRSYGICQWNGGRFDSLKNYCSKNGYSYSSLDGQLNYLKYEIETSEKNNWNKYMQGIADTAEGAGNAAYNFAAHIERCASEYWNGRKSFHFQAKS